MRGRDHEVFADGSFGYTNLVENQVSLEGHFFNGPCAAWFRMNHPLIQGETPSPYRARGRHRRTRATASALTLEFSKYLFFINCDLDHQPLSPTKGENGAAFNTHSLFGDNCCGLAHSALYDQRG